MIAHLLIGFALSFIGSLPFGIINMTVARTAIQRGLTKATFVAMGAAVVEFVQVFVSLKFTWLFDDNNSLDNGLKIIAAIVFLLAGTYFLIFAKPKTVINNEENSGKRRHEFLKGILVSSVNVMAIPFWIFYGSILSANGLHLDENIYVVVFAAGTVLGVFSLLMCYALLGARILAKHNQITKWVNRFIGVILLALGLYQIAGLVGWV